MMGVLDSQEVNGVAIPLELHFHQFKVPCYDSHIGQPWCSQYDVDIVPHV
jgi:hypothetical protein